MKELRFPFALTTLVVASCLPSGNLVAQWNGVTQIEISPWQIRPSTFPKDTSSERVLRELSTVRLTPPSSQLEKDHLLAVERALGKVLTVAPGEAVGVEVRSNSDGDEFAAAWIPSSTDSSKGIRRIRAWDTPEFIFIVLNCDSQLFESRASSEHFLRQMVSWKIDYPYLDSIRGQYGLMPRGILLGAAGRLVYSFSPGVEFELQAIRNSSSVDLVVKLGKLPFQSLYPAESPYVSERFPPLRERIAAWPRERILEEIGRTLDASGPMRFFPNRDVILFRAALANELSQEEVERILTMSVAEAQVLGWRVDELVRALQELNLVPAYRNALAKAALRFGQTRSNGKFAAEGIFRLLSLSDDVDFTAEALECAATCDWPDGAFAYLDFRGTEDTLKKLAANPAPSSRHDRIETVKERIRKRIARK